MNEQNEQVMSEMELSLMDIFQILMSKLWVIIISTIVAGLAGLIISTYVLQPTYQSRLSLYVFNGDVTSKEMSNNDLLMAQRLVNSYIAVLKSDKFLTEVIEDVGLDMTPKVLLENIKMSAITDTELFEIVVSAPSPEMAFKIASSFVRLAPVGIEKIVQTGRTEIVDTPRLAEKPSSPNILMNSVVGALIGFVVASAMILLASMMDTKINSKEDILSRYSVPILGSIPLCLEEKKNERK